MSKNSGYTGLCILHQLKKLYGFDVSRDLVYDMMRNIPMNVVSSLLHRFISEKTFDPMAVDNILKTFPWTAGTVPVQIGNTVIRYFTLDNVTVFMPCHCLAISVPHTIVNNFLIYLPV